MLVSFFILVMFNERWFVSALGFAPCFTFYMYKTGHDLFGIETEMGEFFMRSAFTSLIYTIVAYIVERQKKQSFMGRESPEKAFHRWMKIFETFPEGVALVRGGYLLYANRALKFILNVGLERAADQDPDYELLRSDLKIAVVEQWIKNSATMKRLGVKRPRQMSIWHFLMSDERGTIFKLLPRRGPDVSHFTASKVDFDAKSANSNLLPPEEGLIQDLNDDLIAEMPKYLTLNQIAVKIAGGIDKLLIVRDVTSIVLNENIMEIKR